VRAATAKRAAELARSTALPTDARAHRGAATRVRCEPSSRAGSSRWAPGAPSMPAPSQASHVGWGRPVSGRPLLARPPRARRPTWGGGGQSPGTPSYRQHTVEGDAANQRPSTVCSHVSQTSFSTRATPAKHPKTTPSAREPPIEAHVQTGHFTPRERGLHLSTGHQGHAYTLLY
jgi:hypothetical protein